MNKKFFNSLTNLVKDSGYTVERPKGSQHPRYPEYIYPLDYGYINDTKSSDGDEIDVWIGSMGNQTINGIIISFDPVKKDSEMKLCVGCTEEELHDALSANNNGEMQAILIRNE